jgi:hypothetical protein
MPHPTTLPRRRGLGLFELLISLAISAALLTATAVALDASFKAYRVNQELGDITQRARLALHRLVTELRSATDPAPAADVEAIYRSGINVQTTSIRIDTSPTSAIRYRLVGTQVLRETLNRVSGNWTVASSAVFLDGLTTGDFQITMEPQRSPDAARAGLPCDQLRRASIRLTVRPSAASNLSPERDGSSAITLVSSVVPRKNAW